MRVLRLQAVAARRAGANGRRGGGGKRSERGGGERRRERLQSRRRVGAGGWRVVPGRGDGGADGARDRRLARVHPPGLETTRPRRARRRREPRPGERALGARARARRRGALAAPRRARRGFASFRPTRFRFGFEGSRFGLRRDRGGESVLRLAVAVRAPVRVQGRHAMAGARGRQPGGPRPPVSEFRRRRRRGFGRAERVFVGPRLRPSARARRGRGLGLGRERRGGFRAREGIR